MVSALYIRVPPGTFPSTYFPWRWKTSFFCRILEVCPQRILQAMTDRNFRVTGSIFLVTLFAGRFLFVAETARQIFRLCSFQCCFLAHFLVIKRVFLPTVQREGQCFYVFPNLDTQPVVWTSFFYPAVVFELILYYKWRRSIWIFESVLKFYLYIHVQNTIDTHTNPLTHIHE